MQVLALVPLFFVFARSIADATRQSICRRLTALAESMDCFVADAPRNDDSERVSFPAPTCPGIASPAPRVRKFDFIFNQIRNREGVARGGLRTRAHPCRLRRRLPRRIASASQVRFYVLISIYYRNHEERSDVVIPCKYWHPCRPVPGLLHPLARVRKFESDIISSERGTDRNPSPFLPVRMCVYGNCVVLLRTVFATAPIVPFDLFQSGSACRIIAIAYAFAVIHERPRRASASAAAVRRRIAAIAPRFP